MAGGSKARRRDVQRGSQNGIFAKPYEKIVFKKLMSTAADFRNDTAMTLKKTHPCQIQKADRIAPSMI